MLDRMYEYVPTAPIKSQVEKRYDYPNAPFPFMDQIRRRTGEYRDLFSIVVVPNSAKTLNLRPTLEKTSWLSGRSHAVRASRDVVWGSKSEGLYNCVDIKGNRLDEPEVQETKAGLRIRGMFDGGLSSYVEKAGLLLRAKGVETERVEKVIKPHEFYIPGSTLPVDLSTFKAYLTAQMMSNPLVKDKDLAVQYIKHFEPHIMVRSLQVPERLLDIAHVPTHEDFKMMMSKVFKYVNAREEIMKPGKHVKLSSDKPEDIKFYLTQYLPHHIATNFAKLHNNGLVHNCPHPQNISLAGSIYDLDSITGASLGSSTITVTDINKELARLFDGWEQNPSMINAVFNNDHIGLNMFVGNIEEAKNTFKRQFWLNYLRLSTYGNNAIGSTSQELITSLRQSGLILPDETILQEWATKRLKA